MESFSATVSAIPAEGHAYCFRAGPPGKKLRWGKSPVEVVVGKQADYAATPKAITFADWSALQSDPRIRAIAKGEAGNSEIGDLKGQLDKATAEIERLRLEVAEAIEARALDRSAYTDRENAVARQLQEAGETIADLRQKLARKAKPAAGE